MLRVIWRFKPTGAPPPSGQPPTPPPPVGPGDPLFAGIPVVRAEPVFTHLIVPGGPFHPMALVTHGEAPTDLAAYAHAFVSDVASADKLVANLLAAPTVDSASIEVQGPPQTIASNTAAPAPVKLSAPGPDYGGLQSYLDTAGVYGVGARAVWEKYPGSRGVDVTLLDIEYGWNLEHVEFAGAATQLLYGTSDPTPCLRDHGAAVFGVVAAPDDGQGVSGIAPEAKLLAASPTGSRHDGTWNIAEVIGDAIANKHINTGDVILLEVQYESSAIFGDAIPNCYVPAEVAAPDREAIRRATALGIYVIEASADGSVSLDNAAFKGRFKPGAGDSGAIMVGAGTSGISGTRPGYSPLATTFISNYGSRVDVQGWGDSVVTVGGTTDDSYRDLTPDEADTNKCYRTTFDCTSSAAAMVAGVVTSAIGAIRASGRPLPPPRQLRGLLVETGTLPPDDTGEQHIGPLPDLEKLLKRVLAD